MSEDEEYIGILLRMPTKLLDKVDKVAYKEHRSRNSQIIVMLEQDTREIK